MMSNTHTVNETLIPKKSYDLMKDLAPITGINSQDLLLVINAEVKANNLKEFIALAKSQPGKLNYASSGPGTPYHMAGELFKHMAGVDIVHVPHKGSDQARTAVLGHQVDMMFDAISTIVSHTKGGKLKALGTSGKHRSAVTPDVPTIAEAGVPGYATVSWCGMLVPAAVPDAIVAKLNADINTVIARADMRERFLTDGAEPAGGSSADFGRLIGDEIVKWRKVIKAADIHID